MILNSPLLCIRFSITCLREMGSCRYQYGSDVVTQYVSLHVHDDSRGCGHLQHPGLSVSSRILLDEGTFPGIIIDSLNNVFFRCLRVHMPCLSYAPSSYSALNIFA